MNTDRALGVLLIALLVVDLSWTAAIDNRAGSLEQRVEGVERDQEVIAAFSGVNESVSDETQVTVSLYAYETGRDEAVVVPARITTIPSDGIYLDVGSVAHTAAVQRSIKRAWVVANNSRYRPAHRGVVVRLDPPSNWETVGGGSAALSIATGFAATDPCVELNESVAMTGGLTDDGTVVDVQNVREKAVAAKRRGVEVFVVPRGQRIEVDGIEVVGVATFERAAAYGLDRREPCVAM